MTDLSFHFDCSYKWEYIKTILSAPKIRTALLFNASVGQIQFALQHCEFVVVRIFDPFDEYRGGDNPDFEKKIIALHNPSDYRIWLDNSPFATFRYNPRIRFVMGWNEIYSKRGQAEREQNAKVVAIGQDMIDHGYGVGLGGWAADKSFYADDVIAGVWDSIIEFALAHKQTVSLDVHEYSVTRPANQHLKSYPDGYPDSLLNRQAMQADNFGSIPYDRNEGDISSNYHMGRVGLLLDRSRTRYGEDFMWYRGECAHDYKDDGALNTFIKDVYKPRFGNPRGINTMKEYYNYLHGDGITESIFDEMLLEDYNWLSVESPDSNQGNFIFAHNGHKFWKDFNTEARRGFVSLVMFHGVQPPVNDTEPPKDNDAMDFDFNVSQFTDVNVKTNTGGNVRIRQGVGTDTAVIGSFNVTNTKARYIDPQKYTGDKTYPAPSNGYTWGFFELSDESGGWAALELLTITPIVTQPPPPSEDKYKNAIEQIKTIVDSL